MKGLVIILGWVIATSIALAIFTHYNDDGDSLTVVLGLPVVSVKQVGAYGWLALGQAGTGVLVIAQAGAGVVALTQVGVGGVFGIGQGMISLVTIAQLGIGLFGFLGQIGVGAQAIGQGVWKRRTPEYFAELSDEITELLSWRGAPTW